MPGSKPTSITCGFFLVSCCLPTGNRGFELFVFVDTSGALAAIIHSLVFVIGHCPGSNIAYFTHWSHAVFTTVLYVGRADRGFLNSLINIGT